MNLFRTLTRRKPLLWVGSIIGVLLLVIATLAIYISTRPDEWWRDQLTSTLSQALEREVEIQGDFRLDLGRTITTEAASIRISNPDWAETRDMLQMGSLLLEFDLLSVLGDTLLIHRLELGDVELGLVENQDGQNNWTFAAEPEPVEKSQSSTESDNGFSLPVGIEHLSLQRARFSLSEPRREHPLLILVESVTGSSYPDGKASLDGSGKLNDLPFSLNVLLEHNDKDIQVLPSKVVIGDYKATAEGRILTRKRFRAELDVTGSGPDLSVITRLVNTIQLPAWSFNAKGKIDITGKDITIIGATGTAGKHKVAADGQIAFSSTGPLQLDVKGSGPSLQALLKGLGYDVIPARAAYQVEGKVEMNNNRLVVTAKHARLGPAEASATLSIPDLDTPSTLIVDVTEVKTNNTANTLALVGVKVDLPKVLPANLSGQVKRTKNATELSKVRGSIGKTKINVNGTIGDPPEYHNTRLGLDISGTNLEEFLAHSVDKAIPFKIKGTVAQNKSGTQFENLQLQLANLDAKVHGRVGNWENLKGSELTISAQGPNTDTIAAILNRPVPTGAVKFDGHVRAVKDAFHIDRMHAQLGQSNLSGDLKLIQGKPPKLKGQVSSTFLDFALFQQKNKPEEISSVKTNETPATSLEDAGAGASPQPKQSQVWLLSDTPITLDVFDQIDLDLAIRFDEVVNFMEFDPVHDLKANILLKGRALLVSNLEASGIRGGDLKGNFTLARDAELTRIDVDMKGKQLRFGLAAIPGQTLESYPPVDIETKLSGAGSTYRNLVNSLKGRIKAVQGEGRVSNSTMGLLLSDVFYELFQAINPLAKTEPTTRLQCGVYIVNLDHGKAEIQALVIQTDKLTILSAGTINLNTERIDIGFETRPRKGVGISASMLTNPYTKLGGSLSKPRLELDPTRASVATGAAVATAGLSFLYKGLWDRYFSARDPCGEALKKDAELQTEKARQP
jgi:uncharacterized protein involved in outer membrane biogenesis